MTDRDSIDELRDVLERIVISGCEEALDDLDMEDCGRAKSSAQDIEERLREEYERLGDEIDEWGDEWDVDDLEEMDELMMGARRDRELWRNAKSTREMIKDLIDVD